jgi:hypothetical protein
LIELPEFPHKLRFIHCAYNNISELPDLPSTIKIIHCNDNPIKFITPDIYTIMKNIYYSVHSSIKYRICLINTIFLNNLKTSITSISSMVLISSILTYLTIIIKSLNEPSFDTNLDYNTGNTGENKQNNVVDILNIITKSTDFWSRLQIRNNMYKYIAESLLQM